MAGIDQLHEAGDDAGRPMPREAHARALWLLLRAGLIDELIDEGMEEMAAASDPKAEAAEAPCSERETPGRAGSRG